MDNKQSESKRVFHARIDGSGRIVVPAESRLRKTAHEGETIVLVEDDDGQLHMSTMDNVVRDVQAYYRKLVPKGESLVDELIAERRAEASRE